MTVHQMAKLTGAPYKHLSRWVSSLERQGRLKQIKVEERQRLRNRKRIGQTINFYCNGWKPPADKLYHEWAITELWLKYGANPDATRGPNVSIYLEDMGHPFGEYPHRMECFTGSQSKLQWLSRLARYKGVPEKKIERCDDDINVFVPPGDIDPAVVVANLIEWSKGSDLRLTFSTLDWIEQHGPYEKVWLGLDGKHYAVGERPEDQRKDPGQSAEGALQEST